jgi:hypothetical protein
MEINPHIRPLWAISLEAAYAADMAAQGRHQERQSRGIQHGSTAPHGPIRPGDTDEAMQVRLERGDQEVALDLDAAAMPVGQAWRIAHQKDSGLGPWAPHGRHPSRTRGYTAACTFDGATPVGNSDPAGLSREEVRVLQRADAKSPGR